MNIFELLLFTLPLVLCFLLGRYLYGHIGWYRVVPAVVLGSGWVAFPFVAKRIVKLFRGNAGR